MKFIWIGSESFYRIHFSFSKIPLDFGTTKKLMRFRFLIDSIRTFVVERNLSKSIHQIQDLKDNGSSVANETSKTLDYMETRSTLFRWFVLRLKSFFFFFFFFSSLFFLLPSVWISFFLFFIFLLLLGCSFL